MIYSPATSPRRMPCFHIRRLLPVLLLALCHGLHAQSVEGSLSGTVKDSSGAVVPGATLLLKNLQQGASRSTVSNNSGVYQFLDAKAGTYRLEVSRDGFERSVTDGIVLNVRQELRLDIALVVGSVQTVVQVAGDKVSTIDTETPTISAVYSAADAANLPINTRASATGTSALGIVATLPGVQADHTGYSLQGGLPFQTDVSVDGVTVQDPNGNTPIANAFPSSESISELRADGVLDSAEFGSPGEIVVTTKGGTNKLHGSAFWYHQNRAFDAIAYTYPTTTLKPKLIGNTFGGSAGGPVVIPHLYNGHNKTFFFGVYEGWRHPAQTHQLYKVPSTLMKQGNFSKYSATGFTALNNPFSGGTYGTQLPSINASAQQLLSFFPDPNVGDPTAYTDNGIANYAVNKDSSGDSDQFDIRIDHYFGSNQKFLLWGRFTWSDQGINNPEPLAVLSGVSNNDGRVLKVDGVWTITPHLVNEAGFGFTLYTTGTTNAFDGKSFTAGLGLNGLQNLFYNGIPEIDFNNITHLSADRLNSLKKSNTYVYTDTLTYVRGTRQFKFGGDVHTLQAVTPLSFHGADNYGTFQFNTKNSAGLFTGVDFADFLLGLPYETFYDVVPQDNDGISSYYHVFAQDQWRASSRITLSYGIRYELHPPYRDPHGDIGNFDPSLALAGRAIYPDGKQALLARNFLASANACDPDGVTSTNAATINGAPCMPVLSNSAAGFPGGLKMYPHLLLLPRIGLAIRPFDNTKTVIRAGFGVYHDTELGSNYYSLTGTLQSQTSQYTNTLNTTTHAIGYQWPNIYAGSGNGGGSSTAYGSDYFGTSNSANWKEPYTMQWVLGLDHDLGSGFSGRVSYIGNESHQLVWVPDQNTLPFSNTAPATTQPFTARRFPNWGRINTRDVGANASLHSLQTEINHRFQQGLQFNSIWTYSRSLADNQGVGRQSFAQDSGGSNASSILDRHVDFGNVYGTRRHRWSTTMVYDLPVGRDRAFGSSMPRALDLIVGGWRLSNIFLWQSGPFESPYYPSGEGDPSGTGSGLNGTTTGWDGGHRSQWADKVPGVPVAPANRTRLNWINTSAYVCPGYPGWTPGTSCTTGSGSGPVPNPIGRFGNAGAGSLTGPGTVNLSTGLNKSFHITEGLAFRLEGTFTNVLNHTNLGDPNITINSPSFGAITSSIGSDFGGARTGQVSARLDF